MKFKTGCFLSIAVGLLLFLTVSYSSVVGAATGHFLLAGVAYGQDTAKKKTEPTGNTFPIASIPERNFEFEPVVDGVKVLHDFVIKNEGGTALDITRVKTG